MAYTLLHGHFVIRYGDLPNQGPQPDGDTIKFKPDDPELVSGLPRISGRPPQINQRGISVRLEAIDALETHFNQTHQEVKGAFLARDKLLAHLGFKDIEYFKDRPSNIESANHDSLPGYVLSNGIDANGRLIGFVYEGRNNQLGQDGSTITIDSKLLDKSINTKLLIEGHVYPAFYGTLPEDLREHLETKSRASRIGNKGIWRRATADVENGAAEISSLESLQTLVIWPKLFRRLSVYLSSNDNGLDGFEEWLRKDPVNRDDRILRLDTNAVVRFHDILTISGDSIKLDIEFELIVIQPDPVE